MSKIGDLWFGLRGDDKTLQADVVKAGDKAGASFGARMSASLKKSWSGGEIGKGLVQGLGLAGGLGAATLFTSAIGKIGDVLGDAKDAALEEEVSIQRLNTALRDNIPNWDGNTAAIERVLKARMALGFSDDEQRVSIATLAAATHDQTKALELGAGAIDISRARNIDLASASDAVAKAYAGNTKGLKSMLPGLKLGATSAETLANAFAMVQGAGEDFAKTNAGKLLVSQVKVGESMEKLGIVILPAFTAGTEAAAAVAEDLASNLDGVTKAGEVLSDILGNLGIGAGDAAASGFDLVHAGQDLLAIMNPTKVSNTFGVLLDTVDKLGVSTDGLRTQFRGMGFDVKDGADHSADAIEAMRGSAMAGLSKTEGALGDVGDAATDMGKDVKDGARVATDSVETMRDKVKDAADEAIGKAFDPLITADKLAATNAEISANRRILASSKASKAEKADASDALDSLGKDQASYLADLARAGKTSDKAYATGMAQLKTAIKNASGPTKTELQGVYDWILNVEAVGKVVPINFKVSGAAALNPRTSSGRRENRASGGSVWAGVPYVVGERRAELFVPEANGRIVPNLRSPEAAAAMGGSGTTVNLTMPVQQASDPFETARQLRRLADFGILG